MEKLASTINMSFRVDKKLKKQGYSSYNNILLAIITDGSLTVFEKDYQKQLEVLE